jgi:hypothetical protein
MKTNQVYQYQNKKLNNPLIVITKKSNKGYLARRVNVYGGIAIKPMLIPLKDKSKLFAIKDAKVTFSVDLPKRMRDGLKYTNLVSRALELRKEYLKVRHKKIEAESLRRDIVRLALSSFTLNNVEEGRAYNLRDFSKAMKFKKNDIFYSWVIKHLNKQYDKDHYEQIKTCSDRTLKSIVENYRQTLPCYLGFSKEINNIVKNHFLAYVKEYKRRTK